MARSHPYIAFAAFSLLLILSTDLVGQDRETADSLAVALADTLPPIPLRSVASEVVDARIRLRSLRQHAVDDVAFENIKRDWPKLSGIIEELNTWTVAGLESAADPDWMMELELRWNRSVGQMENSINILSLESGAVSDGLLELGRMQRRWTRAREEGLASGLPPVILANIDSLLLNMKELTPSLETRLNSILELEVEVSLARLDALETVERIGLRDAEALMERLGQNIGPPWPGFMADSARASPGSDSRFYAAPLWELTVRYLDDQRGRIAVHLGIFIILFLLFRWLRETSGSWTKGLATRDTDLRILERPISAAALVALLAIVFVYPNPPNVLVSIATLLSTVPLVRLLATTLAGALHTLLFGIAVFLIVVTTIVTLLPFDWVYARIAILIINVVAVILLVRFSRREKPQVSLNEPGIGSVIRVGIQISTVVLIVAIVADIFGYARLSNHLTNGTSNAAYFVLLFYVGIQVLVILAVGVLMSPLATNLHMVRRHGRLLVRRATMLIRIVMVLFAADTILVIFGVSTPLYSWFETILTDPVTFGAAEIAIGDILWFFLAVWGSILIARFIRFILQEDILSRFKMKRGLPNAISGTVYYILVAIGFVLALRATGMELDRLTLLTGALGVGLGFGLQDIVNNFVSGLILMYESPIQVGDTIAFDTESGVVKRIGIRSSIVQTHDGADINVPNSHLVSNRVTNWTMYDARRRIAVDFSVEYGSDPDVVQDLIIRAAADHPLVEEHPEPVVLFTQMADSSLNFQLRCWTKMGRSWRKIKSDLTRSIYAILGEAGINIPFPQRDVHVKNVD